MNCRELTNDLLADHAGWKLAPDEQRLVAAHLEGCAPCRGRRDEVEVVSSALRNTAPKAPAALLEHLDRAVLGGLPGRRALERRPRLWPWAAAAALLLGLSALVSVQLFKRRPESPTATLPAVEDPRPPAPEPAPELPKPPPPPEPKPEPQKPEPKAEPKPELPSVPQLPKPETPRPEPPKPVPVSEPVKPPAPPPPAPKPIPPPLPKVVVLGDVDGDGVTDIADARRIQQALVLGLPLPPEADVNGDGVVDVADVRQITRAEVAAR